MKETKPPITDGSESVDDFAGVAESASDQTVTGAATSTPVLSDEDAFGRAMRAARKKRGLSQRELARMMEQSYSYVSLLEGNQRRPTERVLGYLKSAFAKSGKPLTLQEETEFAALSHAPDPIGQLTRRSLTILTAQTSSDALHRELIGSDLRRIFIVCADLLQGREQLDTGHFPDAAERFKSILARQDAAALPPTLKAAATLGLADVVMKLGDTDEARKFASAAVDILQNDIPETAPALLAEAKSLQGMAALLKDEYSEAELHMRESLRLYRKLDANPSEASVAATGLTKSYNRLALLALHRGSPDAALSFCESGHAELDRVSPDREDLRNPQRLRLLALQARAYTDRGAAGDASKARELREKSLAGYIAQHDIYGIAKTHLYMAEDLRTQIQRLSGWEEDGQLGWQEDRVQLFGERLNQGDVRLLITQAIEGYTVAIKELRNLEEGLLLSRAYCGLGDMLRYEGIRNPRVASARFAESQKRLRKALILEESKRQERRISDTMESLARLQWDQGDVALAADTFKQVIQQLRAIPTASGGSAAEEQLRRCETALSIVERTIRGNTTPRIFAYRASADRLGEVSLDSASPEWRVCCERLAHAIADAIERTHADPRSYSSLTTAWTQELHDLDARAGQRLVLQSHFSTSHERHPLRGLNILVDDRASELHIARFYATETRIKDAHTSRHEEAYMDICVRQTVEVALGARITTNNHAQLRAAEVLRRLENWGDGYHLLAVDGPAPIHYFVKDKTALIELTQEAGNLDPRLSDHFSDPNSEVCFNLSDDEELVCEIHEVDRAMRAASERAGLRDTQCVEWLTALLGDASRDTSRADVPAL